MFKKTKNLTYNSFYFHLFEKNNFEQIPIKCHKKQYEYKCYILTLDRGVNQKMHLCK